MREPAVLWDLDGTLVDSLGDIAAALNVALASVGEPTLALDEVRRCVGEGARHLVAEALPPSSRSKDRIDTTLARYREAYRANLVVHTVPYPGIVTLLDALRARAVPMAVVTNKPHAPACAIVDRVFGSNAFGVVLGEEESRPRKPDPAPALLALELLGATPNGAFFIGDSAVDLETARRAGLRGIGVAWGIRGREELAAVPGAEIVDTIAQLSAVLGVPSPD